MIRKLIFTLHMANPSSWSSCSMSYSLNNISFNASGAQKNLQQQVSTSGECWKRSEFARCISTPRRQAMQARTRTSPAHHTSLPRPDTQHLTPQRLRSARYHLINHRRAVDYLELSNAILDAALTLPKPIQQLGHDAFHLLLR